MPKKTSSPNRGGRGGGRGRGSVTSAPGRGGTRLVHSTASHNNKPFKMVLIFAKNDVLTSLFSHVTVKADSFTVGRDHVSTHNAGKQAILDCIVATLSSFMELNPEDIEFIKELVNAHCAPTSTSRSVFQFRHEIKVPHRPFMHASQSLHSAMATTGNLHFSLFCMMPETFTYKLQVFVSSLLLDKPADSKVDSLQPYLLADLVSAYQSCKARKKTPIKGIKSPP